MEIYIIFLQSISCIFGCGLIASILLDRIKENDKFQNYVIKFNQYKDNVFSEFRGFSFWGKDKTKKTFFKIVYIVVTNFLKKELSLRAAGLTFYTLTSIVPILVMMHLFLGTPENGENSVSYAMKVWFHDNEAMNKLDLNSREKIPYVKKESLQSQKKNNYNGSNAEKTEKETAQLKQSEDKTGIGHLGMIILIFTSFWGMLRMVMTIDGCAKRVWDGDDRPIKNQVINTVKYFVFGIAVCYISGICHSSMINNLLLFVTLFLIIKYSPYTEDSKTIVRKRYAFWGALVTFLGISFINSEQIYTIISYVNQDYKELAQLILLLVTFNWSWLFILIGMNVSNVAVKDKENYLQRESCELAPAYQTFLTIYVASLFYKNGNQDFDKIINKKLNNFPDYLLKKILNRLEKLGYLDMKEKKLTRTDNPTVGELMYDINLSGGLIMRYDFTDNHYWNDYMTRLISVFADLSNKDEKTALREVDMGEIKSLDKMNPTLVKSIDQEMHKKLNDHYKAVTNKIASSNSKESKIPKSSKFSLDFLLKILGFKKFKN